jgi:hypothetical protein
MLLTVSPPYLILLAQLEGVYFIVTIFSLFLHRSEQKSDF